MPANSAVILSPIRDTNCRNFFPLLLFAYFPPLFPLAFPSRRGHWRKRPPTDGESRRETPPRPPFPAKLCLIKWDKRGQLCVWFFKRRSAAQGKLYLCNKVTPFWPTKVLLLNASSEIIRMRHRKWRTTNEINTHYTIADRSC